MAKVTKRSDAPNDVTAFSIGNADFELPRKNSVYETDDPLIISSAKVNPFLEVEEDAPSAQPAEAAPRDALDPHVNPAADHLSVSGSQAAVEAATANETAIREAVGLDRSFRNSTEGEPTVAESLAATLRNAGVTEDPQLPADAEETAPEVAPPTADTTDEVTD